MVAWLDLLQHLPYVDIRAYVSLTLALKFLAKKNAVLNENPVCFWLLGFPGRNRDIYSDRLTSDPPGLQMSL